ncbi:hypothetical protein [Streptomyces sp. NPDC091259]
MGTAVTLTLTYTNDEGDHVEHVQTVTPEGVAAVLMAMEDHATDED